MGNTVEISHVHGNKKSKFKVNKHKKKEKQSENKCLLGKFSAVKETWPNSTLQ